MTPPERIWVLWAPTGTWSSGPMVTTHLDGDVQVLLEQGWRSEGPYILAEEA